jgi:hypothetical protein
MASTSNSMPGRAGEATALRVCVGRHSPRGHLPLERSREWGRVCGGLAQHLRPAGVVVHDEPTQPYGMLETETETETETEGRLLSAEGHFRLGGEAAGHGDPDASEAYRPARKTGSPGADTACVSGPDLCFRPFPPVLAHFLKFSLFLPVSACFCGACGPCPVGQPSERASACSSTTSRASRTEPRSRASKTSNGTPSDTSRAQRTSSSVCAT